MPPQAPPPTPTPGQDDRRAARMPLIGFFLGAALFLVLAAIGPPEAPGALGAPAWWTLAVAGLMAVWWATEALPIAATALVPLAAFPLLGIAPMGETASAYAHPLIFLFLGGFLLAQGMQRWNLHRRIALSIAIRAGAAPHRLIAGFMAATAFLSMWVSNTATTIMMLPIAASVVGVILANAEHAPQEDARRFGLTMMLCIAYGASIGGIGTLIGTPPNALLAAFFQTNYGIEVSFAAWFLIAFPVVAVMLPLAWVLLTYVVFRFDLRMDESENAHGHEVVRNALAEMGPMTPPERRVAAVFVCIASLWLFRPLIDDLPHLSGISDPVIAIAGALLLFILPAGPARPGSVAPATRLLDWDHAKRIAWDVLILFGGGLALADAFRDTGLAATLGEYLSGLHWLPPILFVLTVATLVKFLTELTSNTATVAALLPIIAALAEATGSNAMLLAATAVMSASLAFMLPVATPPNAIVFASGYVTVPQMVRAGFVLNVVTIGVIALMASLLVPLFFPG